VTNWTESRLKEIVGKSKYTVETVIDDMNEFTNLMQEATRAIASSPTVACAFNSFGVDYYKFISVMIDRQVGSNQNDFLTCEYIAVLLCTYPERLVDTYTIKIPRI
jgi:hypothetical protein